MYFNAAGQLVVCDGGSWTTLTNHVPVATNDWVRLTVQADYGTRTWLVCLNGKVLARNLAFDNPRSIFSAISFEGEQGYADNIHVTTTEPDGIFLASDYFPDSWQIQYFGATGQDPNADPDGDGLSNYQEYLLGTDPSKADTDGDGISDGWEVYFGTNPTVSNNFASVPFAELFETNTIHAGDLNGQNGWLAAPANAAMVQQIAIQQGQQALNIGASNTYATVRQLFRPAGNVVWVDTYVMGVCGTAPTGQVDSAFDLYFDQQGRVVVYDGTLPGWVTLTNHVPVSAANWVRVTVLADYGTQKWSAFLDSHPVATNLGFANAIDSFKAISFEGGQSYADNVHVSTNEPDGIFMTSALLPDSWMIRYFGAVGQDPNADPDHDGMSNLQEYLLGTDPTVANFGTISGAITYSGSQTGLVHVVAATSLNNWAAGYSTVLSAPGSYCITNLPLLQNYWVAAWIDSNGNGICDPSEAVGMGVPVPLMLYSTNAVTVSIALAARSSSGTNLPNWWVLANFGSLSNTNGLPGADTDHDGLTNLQEFQLGTDPNNWDTDGDGLSDGDEVNIYHTDPLVAGGEGPPSATVFTVNGSQTNAVLGTWSVDGSTLLAVSGGGWAEYVINVPSNSHYALEVEVAQGNPLLTSGTFDIGVTVDGLASGRRVIRTNGGTTSNGVFFLPALVGPAPHVARVTWNNPVGESILRIVDLRLLDFEGVGVTNWFAASEASVLAVRPTATSYTSPLCLEGSSWCIGSISGTASFIPDGQTSQVVSVQHGVGQGWYANVLLSPTNATTILLSADNGFASWSNAVAWLPFNLLDTAWTNGAMIRKGDSILLTAVPAGASNGNVSVTILNGATVVTNFQGSVGVPVPQIFDSAGSFTVVGTWSNGGITACATVLVDVVSAQFPGDAACVVDTSRTWDCPGIPDEAVIESDPLLTVGAQSLSTGGQRFTLQTSTDDNLYMVARLGETGPIMASAAIRGTVVDTTLYSTLSTIDTYPDGSSLVEITIWMSAVPSDLTISVSIFAGGICFEDGTTTHTFTAADFDAMGRLVYRMLMSPEGHTSACQYVDFSQDGAILSY
jgi:hypothetical protein